MKSENKIALIFFSRSKKLEAKEKNWLKDYSKNCDLASLLSKRTEEAISKADIPIFHFHEENQRGKTFGERFANAYEEVFRLGYEQVISVGNDCPDLHKINWERVKSELRKGNSVLGPDMRGGAYLIALQNSTFNKRLFQNLTWQKSNLFDQLLVLCQRSTAVITLKQYRDFNTFQDVRLYCSNRESFTIFLKALRLLLNKNIENKSIISTKTYNHSLFRDSPLRAPPIH